MIDPRRSMLGRKRQIVMQEALRTGVPFHEITGNTRKPEAVSARWECMRRMRVELGMSTTAIGKHFGRDHSSVIHALRKMAAQPRYATAPRGWRFAILDTLETTT